MKPSQPAPVSYLASVRTLGDNLLAGVQERVELFSLEVKEEKYRLVQMFAWASAVFYLAMMMITFGSLTLVYMFWDTHRLAALAGLTGLYALMLVGTVIAFRRYLARQPAPFQATQQELEDDRECIRNGN